MTQQYAIYRRHVSKPKTQKGVHHKGWKKILHANSNQKSTGMAILISDKFHFKSKIVTGNKKGHYILIKGSIHQKDMTISNINAPNNSLKI